MTQETIFNIEALPVEIAYVGEITRENNWQCDQWRVTVKSKAGLWCTDYFTGLGHRETLRGVKAINTPGNWFDTKSHSWMAKKPKKPKIADVMYSLFMDASAGDENFHDWCDSYGYSSDSISTLNTYKQCLETSAALRKHFDPETRASIQTIVQDM